MHKYNGQLALSCTFETSQLKARDADVSQLEVHQLSRASLCISCASKVKWQCRAKYLVHGADVVIKVDQMLPHNLSVDLNDWNMQTSICGVVFVMSMHTLMHHCRIRIA